jgi:phage terminase small subunit
VVATEDTKTKLPPKQMRFVQEYLIDLNASAAYKRAYPKAKPESALSNSTRLMRKDSICMAIKEAQDERSKRVEVTADDVLRELMRLAFVDPRAIMKWGPDGVTLKDSDTLPEDVARCVSEASQTTSLTGGTIRIKMASKLDALEKIGRHLGMFKDKIEIEGKVHHTTLDLTKLSDDTIRTLEQALESSSPNPAGNQPGEGPETIPFALESDIPSDPHAA